MSTTPLKSDHPVRSLQGLARSLALPHDFQPQRFPSFPALERTAVIGFSTPTTFYVHTSYTQAVALHRDAVFPVWGDLYCPPNSAYNYQATYILETSGVGASNFANTGVLMSALSQGSIPPGAFHGGFVAGVGGALLVPLPTKYPPIAVDLTLGNCPFIFVPPNCKAFINAYIQSSTPVNNESRFVLDVWNDSGTMYEAMTDLCLSSVNCMWTTWSPGALGLWIRVKSFELQPSVSRPKCTAWVDVNVSNMNAAAFQPNAGAPGAWTFTSTGLSTDKFLTPLFGPSEWGNSILPWSDTKVTTTAALLTNVTQVLNKAGTVLAGRVFPEVQYVWGVTPSYISLLHPAEKLQLALETGVYTFSAPCEDMLKFRDFNCLMSGGATLPVYRLDNNSPVNVMFLTAGSVAETMALTADLHLEFRSSSSLFQLGMSTMTLETFHQAMLALHSVGFFYENPTHAAILAKILQAAKWILPHAAAMVGYERRADVIVSKKPKPPVKASSAKGSGITRAPRSDSKSSRASSKSSRTSVRTKRAVVKISRKSRGR